MSKKSKINRPSAIAAAPARTEFNPDYSHIKRDLGRIGILAGVFFALLIALSFFIK